MSSFPSDLLFALSLLDPSWCSTALYSGQRPEDVRMRNAGHASLVAHLGIHRASAAIDRRCAILLGSTDRMPRWIGNGTSAV
jgi:hypothetical protein